MRYLSDDDSIKALDYTLPKNIVIAIQNFLNLNNAYYTYQE